MQAYPTTNGFKAQPLASILNSKYYMQARTWAEEGGGKREDRRG